MKIQIDTDAERIGLDLSPADAIKVISNILDPQEALPEIEEVEVIRKDA